MLIAPKLSEQTVVITGAASGLGRALARAFGEAGSTVALVDNNETGLHETASGLAKVSFYVSDLSSAADTRRVVDAIRADHPVVHTLIHNAAVLIPQPFAEMPDDNWNVTFNVGMQAAYLLTKGFWPGWSKTGGTAIYVSSRSGIEGFVGETAYCATKHAIEGFVKALGMESTADGIFVHAVTPGMYMHTPMSERIYTEELKSKWVDPKELTPAFLHLAKRDDASLSGQRLNAWELSRSLKASA